MTKEIILCLPLDAFQQAKKRALEVRESTLQLLTPKAPVFE